MVHVVNNDILIPDIRKELEAGKDVLFTPLGVSMRPWIEGGRDSVILRHTDTPKVGDMALAYIGPRYVLHRVVAIEGERVTLMGDGNLRGTESCSLADVIGVVITIYAPNGKTKPLTRGRVWVRLLPIRKYLLKIYRRIYLPLSQYNKKE